MRIYKINRRFEGLCIALIFLWVLSPFLLIHAQEEVKMPLNRSRSLGISYDMLGGQKGVFSSRKIDANTVHITITFDLEDEVRQDDWKAVITPDFTPDFHWAPHLTPTDNHVIDQHVFRSPALIASDNSHCLVLIPDLDIMKEGTPIRWYMDIDAPRNMLVIGMSNSRVDNHVLFRREPGAIYESGKVKVGFYLLSYENEDNVLNPFRAILDFLWDRWGHDLYLSGNPVDVDLEKYVEHTYNWAFNSWAESVWQEFELDGVTVGAPTFIVNTTQSPNYKGEIDEREFRSIWNQVWFSSLRSAGGLYRYARRTNNEELMHKALLTKELALSYPMRDGFFYGLICTDMHSVKIDGQNYNRSSGWGTYYWGNSNRNPYTWNPKESPFHILDMSWTALLMLRWYDELEKDERLLEYASRYAESLLSVQYDNGFFPGWLDLNTLAPMDQLNESPETSLSVTFLWKMFELTNDDRYKDAAIKAMDAIIDGVIFQGRWEDFETYWSCSRFGSDYLIGGKVARNNMYKQNNFSMFWTAEALLESYLATGNERYMKLGQRTLDEMLMTQASWQPPYMYVNVLGGFGVLNADAEWNDSRQSLFAELIIRYGLLLDKNEYIERGIAALKASFVMMYCPENPETKAQWEKVYPFFGKEDYGFMMENYGHGGRTSREGEGMGSFTIYDWGNGAAAEAYNRIIDKYENLNLERNEYKEN
ncbi:MAG: hypothetical protein ACOYEA_02950 [Fermentimonas sp.]|jgi:hypothetical protein